MALQVASGTLTITTGVVGTTFSVSGLAFQPKAIFLSWSGRSTVGSGEATHCLGSGIAVSTSSRRAYATYSLHNNTNMDTAVAWWNDCCVATFATGAALDGKADLDAILGDGFRLIIDDQFATAVVVGWIAWGGDDLTDAAIVDIAEPAATGNQDVSTGFALDTGQDDKAVIFLGASDAAAGTLNTFSTFMVGFAAGNTPVNAILAGGSDDALGTSATYSYCRSGECIAAVYTDAAFSRASVSAWLSTGFRLNWAEVDASTVWNYSALVLKGGRWEVGDFLTSTGTAQTDEATTYVPVSLLLASANRAASTANTTTANQETSIGAATGPAARWVAYVRDKDAAGTGDVFCSFLDTAMYANASSATTQAIEGLCDLIDFVPASGNGFTWVMDDADPAQSFVAYLVGASSPGVSGTLAATESQDTAAIAGQVKVQGALAATEALDTAALTADVIVSGVLATTEAQDDPTMNGTVAWLGSMAATESPDDATVTGAVTWQGTMAAVEGPDDATMTGGVAWLGTLATTEGPDDVTFAGTVAGGDITGTLAATEVPDLAALAGSVIVAGAVAATEASDTLAFAGDVVVAGALAVGEAQDVASLAGTVLIAGTFSATEVTDSFTASGGVLVAGTLAATDTQDAAAFAGTVGEGAITGTLTAIDATDVPSVSGEVLVAGAFALSETADLLAFESGVPLRWVEHGVLEAAPLIRATATVMAWRATVGASQATTAAEVTTLTRATSIALIRATGGLDQEDTEVTGASSVRLSSPDALQRAVAEA